MKLKVSARRSLHNNSLDLFPCFIPAFVSFLQDNAAYQSSEMPLGFMARSGLIDSLMFAEVPPTLPLTHCV
jgi:hypothetical protein